MEESSDAARRDAFYGDEAWDGYHKEKESAEAEGIRLPNPGEILQMMEDIRWLRSHGYPDSFVKAVIRHCSPDIRLVRRLVKLKGPQEAYKVLIEYMP